MYLELYFGLMLVPWISANVTSHSGYHEVFGIPEAKRIKDWEDNFFAEYIGSSDLRIVGGSLVRPDTYPFFAGILIDVFRNHKSVCGSTLLTSNRLVTAAHCWWDGHKQALKFTVVLGTPYLYYGGIRSETTRVVMHPQFNPFAMLNDVAMIYLSAPVTFGANIAPIDLPRGMELLDDFVGMWAVAIGFGKTRAKQRTGSSVLSHVNLQVMPIDECQTAIFVVTHANICTRGTGFVGICDGDSGGPLATFLNGREVLIGVSVIVSQQGCDVSLPSGYSRVTNYYGFITEHL